MHEDSTAFSLDAKPYVMRAWNIVMERHLGSVESCSVREGLFLGSMRVARELPDTTRVSILYRACDGAHQRRALKRTRTPRRLTFFEVVFSLIYDADRPDTSALMTVEDLESDVTIVVGCGIDGVNHHFLVELAAQALRDDCGIVGGTVLRPDGRILTAGLACLSDDTQINPFDGLAFKELGYMGLAKVVREVSSIGPQVFAFRTSRLLDVTGLAGISEDSLSDVCAALVRSAHAKRLKVLHTPYAVATMRTALKPYHPRRCEATPRHLMVNRNLESFSDVTAILKAGIR
jgi:hypothetical protein